MSLENKKFAPKIVKVALQSPWVTIYNKCKAMFEKDNELIIGSLQEPVDGLASFEIVSSNAEKIIALQSLINTSFFLGNIKLVIKLGVINGDSKEYLEKKAVNDKIDVDTIETAFDGNDVLDNVREVKFPGGYPAIYVLFAKEVVQFYNDDITDLYGNFNGLYEDIARDIFLPLEGVFYCTALK